MVKIFVSRYEEKKSDILLSKMSFLSYENLKQIGRYKQQKDRCLSFLGIGMLFAFYDRYTEFSEDIIYLQNYDFLSQKALSCDLKLVRNENGKPYAANKDNLFFNISHSNEMCVLAISDGEVGVDVQEIREIRGDIAKRFFCKEETEYINLDDADENRKTIEIWSIKESYVKMLGKGLGYGLDAFKIDFFEGKIYDNIEKCNMAIFRSENVSDNYVLSYCIPCKKA